MGMVTLITVGTLKEDYLKEAVAEYMTQVTELMERVAEKG